MLIICGSCYFDQLKQACKLKRTNIDRFAKHGYYILILTEFQGAQLRGFSSFKGF